MLGIGIAVQTLARRETGEIDSQVAVSKWIEDAKNK